MTIDKIKEELDRLEEVLDHRKDFDDLMIFKSPEYDSESELLGLDDIPMGLTVSKVQEIYKKLFVDGKNCSELGSEYGVSFLAITFIGTARRGRKYTKHLWHLDNTLKDKYQRLTEEVNSNAIR